MGSYKWVISRVTIVIIHIRELITPRITAHEPPVDICSHLVMNSWHAIS